MQLSRHDLAQLDEAYLAGLPEGSLRVLSVKLLIDLKDAVERLLGLTLIRNSPAHLGRSAPPVNWCWW